MLSYIMEFIQLFHPIKNQVMKFSALQFKYFNSFSVYEQMELKLVFTEGFYSTDTYVKIIIYKIFASAKSVE